MCGWLLGWCVGLRLSVVGVGGGLVCWLFGLVSLVWLFGLGWLVGCCYPVWFRFDGWCVGWLLVGWFGFVGWLLVLVSLVWLR